MATATPAFINYLSEASEAHKRGFTGLEALSKVGDAFRSNPANFAQLMDMIDIELKALYVGSFKLVSCLEEFIKSFTEMATILQSQVSTLQQQKETIAKTVQRVTSEVIEEQVPKRARVSLDKAIRQQISTEVARASPSWKEEVMDEVSTLLPKSPLKGPDAMEIGSSADQEDVPRPRRKHKKVLIKGVPVDVSPEACQEQLAGIGVKAIQTSRMTNKKTEKPNKMMLAHVVNFSKDILGTKQLGEATCCLELFNKRNWQNSSKSQQPTEGQRPKKAVTSKRRSQSSAPQQGSQKRYSGRPSTSSRSDSSLKKLLSVIINLL